MKLFIYNLQEALYEGDAISVSLPAEDGEITILPNHAKLVTSLREGTVKIKNGETEKTFDIKNGVAYIDGKTTIILAN